MKKLLLIFIFIFFSFTITFAQNSSNSSNKDVIYNLLIQKGKKLEKSGDFFEAWESYEKAYELTNNIYPILRKAALYSKANLPKRAINRLKELPYDKLSVQEQAEVSYYLGNSYVLIGKYNDAAKEYINSLKLVPNNGSAKVRLAIINIMNGMTRRSEELLEKETFCEENGYTDDDYRICLAVDFHNAYFSRAYETCRLISVNNIKVDSNMGVFKQFLNIPFIMFFNLLPLFLSKTLLVIYITILFVALSAVGFCLSKNTNLKHLFIFVIGSVLLIFLCNLFSINNVYASILKGHYYFYDGNWILPKTLIASHIIAYSLFLIFPCFLRLPDNMRPTSFELFGIWFFCFFFGLFVLSFQCGNIKEMPFTIISFLCISFLLSIISALTLPLSKLLFFKLSQIEGLAFLGKFVDIKITENIVSEKKLSYTDIKVLENKMWVFIGKGDIPSALALAKKVLNNNNKKDFPLFWLGMIVAHIFNDDYELAAMNMNDYYKIFKGTDFVDSCQVYEAYFKSEKGDFATAYKLINSISDSRAKTLTSDEAAISLMVLARCCINGRDNIQGHANYTKALSCVKSNYFKIVILADVSDLDIKVNSKSAMQKWKTMVANMSGTDRCIAYLNTVKSMVAFSENRIDDAIKIASESVKDSFPNGKAIMWYGHLLCVKGLFSKAEDLLSKMKSGSYNAERLMTEVTAIH